MDGGCERKRGVSVDPKVFGLNHWKDGNAIYRGGETWSECIYEG